MPDFLQHVLANTWITLKFVAAVYAVGLILEHLHPAESRQPWRHVLFNLRYTVLFLFFTFLLVPPLAAAIKPITTGIGGLVPISLPEAPWAQLLQGLVFLFIFDFFYYWFHRAQHSFGWLWNQHKLHHSEFSVNVTTGNRHHWLEEPLRVFLVLLPMGVLFDITPGKIPWIWSGLMLWGYMIHMNVRLNLGPLTPVVAGPQLHRLHHSFLPQHIDRNYAAFFPVWDILFGTYVAPKKGEYPRTGLVDGEDLNGLWRASVSAFPRPRRALPQAETI